MRMESFASSLIPDGPIPMALQIAKLLADAIRRRDLLPGEALPGTRPLAEALGASRYAILGALKELEMEGFLELRQGSGAFVVSNPPGATPKIWGESSKAMPPRPETPGFEISSQLMPVSAVGGITYDLTNPQPDPRLAPQEALAKAYQRAIRRHGDQLLGLGEPKGNVELRRELAAFLHEHRGLKLDAEQILITRGGRDGLDLLLESLGGRGGRLGVEDPGNPALWEMATARGWELIPVPLDEEGIRIDSMETHAKRSGFRALLVQPLAQIPTGTELSPSRRAQLLDWAATNRVAIVEDDSSFPFTGKALAPLPLAALDNHGSVVYLLSLTRLLAPGLRLGLLAGPRSLMDRLARLRRTTAAQGDRVLEWAVADLIRDGDFERALRRNARVYGERLQALAQHFHSLLEACFFPPSIVGVGLWLLPRPGFNVQAWVEACGRRSVKLRPPSAFRIGTPGDGVFLAGACISEDEREDLVDHLLAAASEQHYQPN